MELEEHLESQKRLQTSENMQPLTEYQFIKELESWVFHKWIISKNDRATVTSWKYRMNNLDVVWNGDYAVISWLLYGNRGSVMCESLWKFKNTLYYYVFKSGFQETYEHFRKKEVDIQLSLF